MPNSPELPGEQQKRISGFEILIFIARAKNIKFNSFRKITNKSIIQNADALNHAGFFLLFLLPFSIIKKKYGNKILL